MTFFPDTMWQKILESWPELEEPDLLRNFVSSDFVGSSPVWTDFGHWMATNLEVFLSDPIELYSPGKPSEFVTTRRYSYTAHPTMYSILGPVVLMIPEMRKRVGSFLADFAFYRFWYEREFLSNQIRPRILLLPSPPGIVRRDVWVSPVARDFLTNSYPPPLEEIPANERRLLELGSILGSHALPRLDLIPMKFPPSSWVSGSNPIVAPADMALQASDS